LHLKAKLRQALGIEGNYWRISDLEARLATHAISQLTGRLHPAIHEIASTIVPQVATIIASEVPYFRTDTLRARFRRSIGELRASIEVEWHATTATVGKSAHSA